jgi:hypothetical protein
LTYIWKSLIQNFMKPKFFFYTANILLIIFSSCTKDLPTASYTHYSKSYVEGDTIYFTSTSSNADNFVAEGYTDDSGTTNSIVPNQLNLYTIPTIWYPYNKKSAGQQAKQVKILERVN